MGMGVVPIQSWRLPRRYLHGVMQCLSGRRYHIQGIVLRRFWRNVQPVEVKICHLHAWMANALFSRLGGELIFIFHAQNASRLHPKHRRRVVALIPKLGFAGDWIRCGYERHRRGCLWQFRKYSILSAGGGDKQTDARYPPRGSYRELLQNSHTAFPTNSPLPTTLAVRFRS